MNRMSAFRVFLLSILLCGFVLAEDAAEAEVPHASDDHHPVSEGSGEGGSEDPAVPLEPTDEDENNARQGVVDGDNPQPTVTIDITPDSLVLPGSNVTVTCRLKGTVEGSLVKFVKVVINLMRSSRIATEVISILTVLESPYKHLNRYRVTSYTDAEDIIYELHITDVQFIDSGDYACTTVVDTTDLYALKLLEVYQVPENIYFVGNNESGELNVTENDVIGDLLCRVDQLMPHASVALTTAGGTRDVTDDFLLASVVNAKCTDIGDYSKTCPLHQNYNMTAVGRSFRARYTDDGTELVCRATMRDFTKDVSETSITLNVRYRPKIVCTKTDWAAVMNATEVNIHCVVYANPPVDATNRTWIVRRKLRSEMRLNFPHQSDEYQLRETKINDNPNVVKTTLIINKALRDYFYNTYTLQATNELGTEQKELRLVLTSAPTGGASQPSPGVLGFFRVIALSLLLASIQQLLRGGY